MQGGQLDTAALNATLVNKAEVDKQAHSFGFPSMDVFERAILENDGRLTAILKPEYRPAAPKKQRSQ